jgi:hypothetical protein
MTLEVAQFLMTPSSCPSINQQNTYNRLVLMSISDITGHISVNNVVLVVFEVIQKK